MAEQVPNVENTAQESNNEPNAKNRNKTVDNPVKTDGVVSQKESKESETLKAFFEKQGLSEEELKKAISMYKENIPKSSPDIIVAKEKEQKYMQQILQAQIENKAMLEALKMGVDANTVSYVIKLADLSNATIADEKGTINDEKIKDAISKILTDVPQLKKAPSSVNGFRKIGADKNESNEAETLNSLRKAFGLKSED